MANQEERQIPYVIAAPAKPGRVTLIPHEEVYTYYTTKQIVVESLRNRTVFQNLEEVAKYMRIPASYLIVYFGFKLGVPIHQTTGSKQLFLRGSYDPTNLSKICQEFVKEVLTCPRCKLPEITMDVDYDGKYEKVKGKCLACAYEGWMLENNPKFAAFVIKNSSSKLDNISLHKLRTVNITEEDCSSTSKDDEEHFSFEEDVKEALQASNPSTVMKLLELAVKRHAKSSTETSQVVFQTIFGTECSYQEFLSNLKTHQQLIQLFLHSHNHRLNAFLEALLQRLEGLSSTQQKTILKMLYDEEIVEEEDVIGWFDACAKNLLEKFPSAVGSVMIFVEWLKQPAESDE